MGASTHLESTISLRCLRRKLVIIILISSMFAPQYFGADYNNLGGWDDHLKLPMVSAAVLDMLGNFTRFASGLVIYFLSKVLNAILFFLWKPFWLRFLVVFSAGNQNQAEMTLCSSVALKQHPEKSFRIHPHRHFCRHKKKQNTKKQLACLAGIISEEWHLFFYWFGLNQDS